MIQNQRKEIRLNKDVWQMLDFIVKSYPYKFESHSQVLRAGVIKIFNEIRFNDIKDTRSDQIKKIKQEIKKISMEMYENAT
jgi:hypothetical protein